MTIVITDGYTLNPGDLDWAPLNNFGSFIYHDRSTPQQVVDRCKDADIIICNKVPITKAVIDAAPKLKLITIIATGYNNVDVAAAAQRGITVCNVPEYGTWSVAQHTIALLLELTNHVGIHAQSVKNGDWEKSADWCYAKKPFVELYQKTMGIVGYGRIGRQVGQIAKALGMHVIYYSYHQKNNSFSGTDLQTLFSTSDVVSLHCPLTKDNREFVNRELLAKMKPTAFLINTSRGMLVNEDDLYLALSEGLIAGAALDVLQVEPPVQHSRLFDQPNCIVTPHNAWISFEARKRIMETTIKNIKQALDGSPVNVVG
jgi:glycerate dehydrogenase